MEYFLNDAFFRFSGRTWSKDFLGKLFKCLKDFEESESPQAKSRNYELFSLELKMAHKDFLRKIKDLKMIMNCRVKGDDTSHFGGRECGEFADSVQRSCNKFLSSSPSAEGFQEGSIEAVLLKLRNKAKEDEKYAWEAEKKAKQDYLNLGVDNTAEILEESGYEL